MGYGTGKKKRGRTPKPAEEGANEEAKANPTDPDSQTVEPVFGQMKETPGTDRFMMRGEEEPRGEWSLHGSAHNVKKLHSESVLGVRPWRTEGRELAPDLKR